MSEKTPVTVSFSLLPEQADFINDRATELFKMGRGARSYYLRQLIDAERERVGRAKTAAKKK